MKPLRVLNEDESWSKTNELLSEFIDGYCREMAATRNIDILEAGCGRQWNLSIEAPHEITGVDVSKEAMDNRMQRFGDIDHQIVGDLATVSIDRETFDIVYCSYVLEHLTGAEAVLKRFFDWLRPGGLAILLFPDRV